MSILIRNARIVDGEKPPSDPVDLFVREDKIAGIGRISGKSANISIDAENGYVFPGFIDTHTTSDHHLSILNHPEQEDFLLQGVTTIVGGLSGVSLAPLLDGGLESIKSIKKWTVAEGTNVNWRTVAEFLASLDRRRLGPNFLTLAGHETIRSAIAGDTPRNLAKNELLIFEKTLERALEEGAFGLSMKPDYLRASHVSSGELKRLADVVGRKECVFAMRADDALDLSEPLQLSAEAGVKTVISHFLPTIGHEKKYLETLAGIDRLPPESNVRFDLYPFEESIKELGSFLPPWARNWPEASVRSNLDDQWMAKRITKELPRISDADAEHFILAKAFGNEALEGKNLVELKELFGLKKNSDALLRLMRATGPDALVSVRDINRELLRRALRNPRSFIASHAAGVERSAYRIVWRPERATSTFTKFISSRERGPGLTLDEAVRKITSAPARFFGIEKRGYVKEGYFADLVVFQDEHIRFVVVNGALAVSEGKYSGIRAGRALRHHG